MSKRQLVKDAIAHRTTPRVPYCINFTGEGAERLRGELQVDDLDAFVDNDVERVGIPWWTWHELAEDWAHAEPPHTLAKVIGTGPSHNDVIERIKQVADETGRYVLVIVYGSHFEKAYFARGLENFLADLGGEPEFAQQLLGRIIEKNLVMLENVLALPEIDGVLLGSDWGSQKDLIMSPSVWEELIRPGEQREYDLIHGYGKDVWIHSCGNIERILPSLVEMGVDVLNPVQPECMDIRRLKEWFGAKLTFWGGISTQRTLPYGTPAEVRAETRAVRALMAAGGGYILSPAQEIQADVPSANLLALLEIARSTEMTG